MGAYALAEGIGRCLYAVLEVQLAENAVQVTLHRSLHDVETRCYLGIAHPLGHELKDLALSPGQVPALRRLTTATGPVPELVEEPAGHRRGQRALAAHRPPMSPKSSSGRMFLRR